MYNTIVGTTSLESMGRIMGFYDWVSPDGTSNDSIRAVLMASALIGMIEFSNYKDVAESIPKIIADAEYRNTLLAKKSLTDSHSRKNQYVKTFVSMFDATSPEKFGTIGLDSLDFIQMQAGNLLDTLSPENAGEMSILLKARLMNI